mmetsp:Transcript_27946/g.68000  ORF Transcript_27946/g.68000 Transcript_27946/m.68000 type:complete len:83 (-) Transcript_27946:975-1223(-)
MLLQRQGFQRNKPTSYHCDYMNYGKWLTLNCRLVVFMSLPVYRYSIVGNHDNMMTYSKFCEAGETIPPTATLQKTKRTLGND